MGSTEKNQEKNKPHPANHENEYTGKALFVSSFHHRLEIALTLLQQEHTGHQPAQFKLPFHIERLLVPNIPRRHQIAVSLNEKCTVAIHQVGDHVLGA
jgi:hypothetical protein